MDSGEAVWKCRLCGYQVDDTEAKEMMSKPPYAAMCPNCDDETLIRQEAEAEGGQA